MDGLCLKGGTPQLVGKEALSFSNLGSKEGFIIKVLGQGRASQDLTSPRSKPLSENSKRILDIQMMFSRLLPSQLVPPMNSHQSRSSPVFLHVPTPSPSKATPPAQLQCPRAGHAAAASQAHFPGREGTFPACQGQDSALNIPSGTEKPVTRAAALWGIFPLLKHLH